MAKQYFKSLYFSDIPAEYSKDKTLTLAFNEPEMPYYAKIKEMSTQEVKDLIGVHSYQQLSLFAEEEERSLNQVVKRLIKQKLQLSPPNSLGVSRRDLTFSGSKAIPFQRWYPYIEGYSPEFVKTLIKNYNIHDSLVFDPFAGTGTTIFAADTENLPAAYAEVNPLLQFLIQTKISVLGAGRQQRLKLADRLELMAAKIFADLEATTEDGDLRNAYSDLFGTSCYFQDRSFSLVLKLRSHIDSIRLENELLADVLTVAALACLLPASLLKKAGDVRFKTPTELEKEHKELEEILPAKLLEMSEDIRSAGYSLNSQPEFVLSNAKNIGRIHELKIGAVITSPPYLNGTNYFRNTKLELWFLRYLRSEHDLRFFRDQALTSGINDVTKALAHPNGLDIASMSATLRDALLRLKRESYDARIPVMVESYFKEMHGIFRDMRPSLAENAVVLIDIGDSIFAGVHIQTDTILTEILEHLGYKLQETKLLRKRRSRNQEVLSQSLLVLHFSGNQMETRVASNSFFGEKNWQSFKIGLPHQQEPYSKRNWGHPNHSLCSYQGKLKPAIAHHLVKTFVPEGGSVLDPFSGVGTIPFEAALAGKMAYGIDISAPAYFISSAKVSCMAAGESRGYIRLLDKFIRTNQCTGDELLEAKHFGFNKKLADYYEEKTLREILLARRFLKQNPPKSPAEMLVAASLLHILHGNRPYALSRRSHPIVPYAPAGDFIYKNLINNLTDKVERTLAEVPSLHFKPGKIFHQDTTEIWPQEITHLDAVITSPPFFDSTRFYLANWIRIWFAGWSETDFKQQVNSFVEEKQKRDFGIYAPIFRQAKERLKKDGVCVLHLGKSVKCDMAAELQKVAKRWFRTADLFDENVEHCESHGIRDKGTVTSHQYLVLV